LFTLQVPARRDQRTERALCVALGVAAAWTGAAGRTIVANKNWMADADARPARPIIRKIGSADLRDALANGIDDFKAKPSHIVLLVIIYPIIGFFLIRLSAGYDVLPLVFPLFAGFALIGPLAAVGLYELSRRREQGLDFSWWHAFDPFRSPSIGAIMALGIVQLALYFAWLSVALAVYQLTFGNAEPESIAEFARQVFTTPSGWALIVVGCGIGFLFAVVVLAVSVVSFPLLLDRDVGAVVALQTSVKSVLANPITMAKWGLIVAGALVIGCLPFFFGLAVVMPVLGHATWHLYRKVVEP